MEERASGWNAKVHAMFSGGVILPIDEHGAGARCQQERNVDTDGLGKNVHTAATD